MSIWIVIPTARLGAVRAAYAAAGVREGETIGDMVPNKDGTKLMTGSSRITAGQSDQIRLGNTPWLEVYTDWPAPGWVGDDR